MRNFPLTLRSAGLTARIYRVRHRKVRAGYVFSLVYRTPGGRQVRQFVHLARAKAEGRKALAGLAATAGGAVAGTAPGAAPLPVLIQPLDESEAAQLERARQFSQLFRRAQFRLARIAAPLMAAHRLTTAKYLLLLQAHQVAGLTQSQAAVLLDSDTNTISALARGLVRRGLLERQAHPADGRAWLLQITPAGSSLVGRIRPRLHALWRGMYAQAPRGHQAAIAEWLTRLAEWDLTL